ncbi:D-xylose 1-dehydrogenase (NADP(+)) 2 [Hypsizygus marmoreus]|uniref:D-xylose 1-dehydrogenase (NADP(+), D-xylono-1,5-lactone-forming) n=1 Tax=Hypsizygus marmoreus TaxID=39966 RepID=A0A369K2S1_HYPMA|nr:D-xylose 1-dehydrogenase (NADP(+)) 2 [Hypsizygus marmoreus]
MALAIQAVTFAQQYAYSWLHPAPKKTDQPLKLGVLSSAQINAAAVIHPTETHPDVILYAIASRDSATAKSQAHKYGFLKSYGSYDDLLEDPAIDMVYISAPNGLHFEWASKALDAGKHVLLEKPFTSNAMEAKKLVEKAEKSGKILMEAFHWQFHPAAHCFRQILNSGKYGKIIQTHAIMTSTPEIPGGDVRWQYDLAGGSLMDMTYVLSFTRYALKADLPLEVISAKARPAKHDPRVDAAMDAKLLFKTIEGYDVHSTIYTDMDRAWKMGVIPRFWELPSIEVETEQAKIYFYNAMMPHVYHYISITDKETGRTTYEKHYSGGPQWLETGEAYWSTYRYQLEAFVDKVRGRQPAHWVTNRESILQMETIDEVYRKSGLPLRPTSVMAVSA